jgi:hypothetical protein
MLCDDPVPPSEELDDFDYAAEEAYQADVRLALSVPLSDLNSIGELASLVNQVSLADAQDPAPVSESLAIMPYKPPPVSEPLAVVPYAPQPMAMVPVPQVVVLSDSEDDAPVIAAKRPFKKKSRKETRATKARIVYHTKTLRLTKAKLSGIRHSLSQADDAETRAGLLREKRKLRVRLLKSEKILNASLSALKT